MIQEFEPVIIPNEGFCPNISAVSQIGYVNLRVAMATGSVPADLTGTENVSNGIDDPRSIIGKPDDVFSAMRANDAYKALSKSEGGAPSSVLPDNGGNSE